MISCLFVRIEKRKVSKYSNVINELRVGCKVATIYAQGAVKFWVSHPTTTNYAPRFKSVSYFLSPYRFHAFSPVGISYLKYIIAQ